LTQVLTPRREVDPIVLRAILGAIRENRSVEIHYQSMNRERADPMWRRMTPHAFGYDDSFEGTATRKGIVGSYDPQTPDLRFRKPFSAQQCQ
jgi:hypothetical protein